MELLYGITCEDFRSSIHSPYPKPGQTLFRSYGDIQVEVWIGDKFAF